MLGRALSLATVTLLIGFFATEQVHAQATNLEAGKSPSQIFAGTCNACHKSPRGLLKTVAPGSLTSFLRQHYTTSPDMAGVLSSYLVSNGAADTRYVSAPPKQPGAKPDDKPVEQLDRNGRKQRPSQEAAKPEPEQTAKPDADGLGPQGEPGRSGRKRLARPEEAPDARPAAEAGSERGPDGRKLSAKQRLSKRGKPGGEESPKADTAKDDSRTGEPANEATKTESGKPESGKSESGKSESGKSEIAKSESAKPDSVKPDAAKPANDNRSETAKADTGGATPVLRPDPVPDVTPAPPASAATDSGGTTAQTAVPAAEAPAAVAASAPPPVPAGPPEPPISQ